MFLQATDRVSWVLPGTLLPFKKEISNIFRLEKAKFFFNKHFNKIFANTDIPPVYVHQQTKPEKTDCKNNNCLAFALHIKKQDIIGFEKCTSCTMHAR